MRRKSKKMEPDEKVVLYGTILFFAYMFCFYFTRDFLNAMILLFVLTLIFGIFYFIYLYRDKLFHRGFDAKKIRWKLEDSNPYEFEELVADMFKRLGYQSVKTTPKSGDVGADITMKRKGIKYVVQVKKYAEDNKIGRPDLQRLQGSAQHFHATGMIFVTYGFYSRPALDYAKQHGIETIDNNELINLMNRQYKKER